MTTAAGTTTSTFDADSNVLTVCDGNSQTTTMTYDNDCRLLTSTRANGDEMQYTYDGTGQKGLLSSSKDGKSANDGTKSKKEGEQQSKSHAKVGNFQTPNWGFFRRS